jgi:hypothetical protein
LARPSNGSNGGNNRVYTDTDTDADTDTDTDTDTGQCDGNDRGGVDVVASVKLKRATMGGLHLATLAYTTLH